MSCTSSGINLTEMTDLIGVTINNYRIEEMLGGGGMGIVYRARHPILELDVAIKVMRPELARQKGFYARFEREAQAIARLQHPGIVSVTNFGQHDGITYLMMDLIEGPTMRELLRDSPFGLPLGTAIRLTQLLADALAYAHSKGILHLDLKPDNILLDADRSPASAVDQDCPYRPVISDFGLARLRVAPGISIHTTQRIGTPHYMSPEQCLGKSINERSDIYSLGIMLYESLAGQRPFPISTLVQAVHFHGSQLADPPSTHRPGLPAALDALVLKMLAKQPAERPSLASEVAEQLAEISASSTPPPVAGAPPAAEGAVVTPPEVDTWSTDRAPVYIQVTYQGKQIDRFPMKSESILAGRLPTCDLQLAAGDRLVSKRHCEIRRRNGEMVIRDLHSTNKTILDEVELEPDVFSVWPTGVPVRLGAFTLKWIPVRTGALPSTPAPAVGESYHEGGDGPTIECANAKPKALRLTDKPITIGRLPSCGLVIADPAVSKQHCQVHWDGTKVTVKDLDSTNGTCLGEVRLGSQRQYRWHPDIDVRIGPYEIRLVPAEPETMV